MLPVFPLSRWCVSALLLTAAAHAKSTPVILISIDTLRADRLSAYGSRRVPTPNLDSFGQNGTLFENADAQVPLTLPSHTSLFTSTYPFENRIEENAERVPPGTVTLATVLQSRGYKTAAFIGSVFLERQLGLDQGFEFYDAPFNFPALSPLSGSMFFGGAARDGLSGRDRRDGGLVIRAAAQWLGRHRAEPVFAFVHLYDLHQPYKLDSYDAELEYTDRVLGSFRKTLEQQGWWDKALVVLLADHGESLGDHGEANHGYFIYESTLWVPLLFHWPAGEPGHPPRVPQPVGLIGVAPAILDYLHIPIPASFRGKSVFAAGESSVYGESLHAHDAFGWAPLRSLRNGPYKYIEAPKPELYNLQSDPHERTNIVAKNPAQARALRDQLTKLLAQSANRKTAAPGTISPETQAVLGSLGYLAAGPGASMHASGADPKDRFPEFQLYEKAMVLLYRQRRDEAVSILRSLLARDPHNTLARRDLGSTYLDQKLYAKARACFEQVMQAAPDDYVTQYELGIAEEHLGLLNEARVHLQSACTIAPEAVQCRRELEQVEQRMK